MLVNHIFSTFSESMEWNQMTFIDFTHLKSLPSSGSGFDLFFTYRKYFCTTSQCRETFNNLRKAVILAYTSIAREEKNGRENDLITKNRIDNRVFWCLFEWNINHQKYTHKRHGFPL